MNWPLGLSGNWADMKCMVHIVLFCNRGDTRYHGGLHLRELCQAPISWMQALSSHPHPSWLWFCTRRNFFLKFANAKVAATGFEPETRGDLSSLSNSRALTIAATAAELALRANCSNILYKWGIRGILSAKEGQGEKCLTFRRLAALTPTQFTNTALLCGSELWSFRVWHSKLSPFFRK